MSLRIYVMQNVKANQRVFFPLTVVSLNRERASLMNSSILDSTSADVL